MTEILCPECLAKGLKIKMHKAGLVWSGRKKIQRHRCPNCGRTTTISINKIEGNQE